MIRKQPRWYQEDAAGEVMGALQAAGNVNPVAAIVTGGGKSLILAMLIERIAQVWPAARVLILAPSRNLVSQNYDEAMEYLAPALKARVGVYCAGLRRKERLSQYVFGTPQSVHRQAKKFGKIDFVLVDEAHTFNVDLKTAKNIVEGLPGAPRYVGVTATPFVMKGLKVVPLTQCGLFDAKVIDLTTGRNFNRLLREGFIAPIVAPSLRFPQINTDGVKTAGGEFDEAELAKRAQDVTAECVSVALEHTRDRKHFMWFAVNIEHAEMIHRALREAGESAVVIHGNIDNDEQLAGVEEYLAKQHRHIVSVAMLTTGFNAQFVDCIVSLRPTKSLVLWRQIVGRGLRIYLDKLNCLVLDAGGNFARHGAINAAIDSGDSRSGLWECTDAVIETPFKRSETGERLVVAQRERSSIRFPVNSGAHVDVDLRVILGLMEEDAPACGYLNDVEHLTCRQCGRPRQGFLARRERRASERKTLGDGDSYDLHDEEGVILKDESCRLTRQLPVHAQTITAAGNSVLNFTFETDFGPYSLRLDFDRNAENNKFYAMSRKYFLAATGRQVPNDAYRVLLLKETIPAPIDITLTKYENDNVFLTEVRFIHDGQLKSFRYDPNY